MKVNIGKPPGLAESENIPIRHRTTVAFILLQSSKIDPSYLGFQLFLSIPHLLHIPVEVRFFRGSQTTKRGNISPMTMRLRVWKFKKRQEYPAFLRICSQLSVFSKR